MSLFRWRKNGAGAADGTPQRRARGRLVIDAERCTGCGCCEMACSLRNLHECNPSRSAVYIARSRLQGEHLSMPVVCEQCEDALCVMMCPGEALRKEADGVVVVDRSRCIGCRTCTEVCPFGAPAVDPRVGVSQKCTLCDGDPLCVEVCREGALVFTAPEEEGPLRKRSALAAYLDYAEAAGSSSRLTKGR